ncbi:MAG: DUF2505 family protein [Myxococcales bacterium]|nr:DUF2505 family protein [Myxococcales bacterium]MCB9629615.1 DUF2505 family protein [Sandaracinaceae bacterium]
MSHVFACSPAELLSVLDDPSFDERMSARTGVVREVLERKEDESGSYVRFRVTANKEIPAVMAKAIGADRIRYEQESRRAAGSTTLAWTIIPMVLASKFQGSGTTTVRATATGCERVIEGELVVKVPIVGKQMEAKLLESVEESYNQAAALAAEMLAERAAGA